MFEWEFLAKTIQEQRLHDAEKARMIQRAQRISSVHPTLLRRMLAEIGVQLCKAGVTLQHRYGEVEFRPKSCSTSVL